ncbi:MULTISPECIES: flagellar hook protein FlgE [unclassified Modestobacter]|uniref:flagellar hook protein FlgE n=1 Tax=unclassified Modestobacter TaxID=2643866 RepID=UPI0022AB0914|nr:MULTISPECIES: flagellar hook protein FlgE [unclassified Modestobacter]MCZ2810414.1 flagellar hook protein FlgE [Modestobacter sp. VKM Ac-2979]MCZ2841900.1 flagellar hook protein FlgE [Modestobacter sp. VKM Ac-2980]MCZ2847045.1 flagellar hook protein FlgE [Modestobacter sp. VKM Ac-2978]
MLRSMFSAISGLRAHQTKLDVAGNNIANVNTVGFKASQTVFEDTLSQVLRNGAAPNGDVAGTNPAQVGLGVKVAGITTNFGQGSTQNTGRASDFMISGDGFFVTKVGNEQLYTRAGSFDTDGVGNLVTPDGAKLQGWMANALGVVDPNGPIQDLRIPTGQVLAPVATTGAALAGNLSATVVAGETPVTSQVNMYDDLGNAHPVNVEMTRNATPANSWNVTFTDTSTATATSTGTALGSVTLQFADGSNTYLDANGQPRQAGTLATPNPATFELPTSAAGVAAWTQDVDIDLSAITQFGGKSDAAAKTTAQSGSAMGVLEGYSLANDGTIVGIYSNGLRQNIGQLALATFTNPGGLEKAGNSSFRAGDNSGNPLVGQAGTGGRGSLSAGALEMSNVDLAEEFTGLIVAQRGFQANSRVITTSDEILQDLVQLKR